MTVKSTRATRAFATVSAALAMFALAACSDDPAANLPGPRLAQGGNGCDLKDATHLARDYFPGNGNGSIKDQALDLISEMEIACDPDATDATTYTDDFFALAALIEQVLEDGSAGAAADGDALLWELIKSPERDAAFVPCDQGDPSACVSWDGFPDRPDFTGALSMGGTWAVVSTGSAAVCQDHQSPCTGVDPSMGDPDTWGVEPSSSWDAALHNRTSVLFGNPLTMESPTGETAYAGASGYAFNLIPHPGEFDPDHGNFLEVGYCSATPSTQEALIQKGSTVLEQAFLSFCGTQSVRGDLPESPWGRLAAFVGDLFDPRPRPLVATLFRLGPGGGAGSWSDFWAIDIPIEATFEFRKPPVDGTVGDTIKDADGNPVTIRAITTSKASPIENVSVTVSFQKNNGFLSTGDAPDGDDDALMCHTDPADPDYATCTGNTQADEDPMPGSLELPLVFSKTGAYRICVTGELLPLDFDTVCSAPINIRP